MAGESGRHSSWCGCYRWLAFEALGCTCCCDILGPHWALLRLKLIISSVSLSQFAASLVGKALQLAWSPVSNTCPTSFSLQPNSVSWASVHSRPRKFVRGATPILPCTSSPARHRQPILATAKPASPSPGVHCVPRSRVSFAYSLESVPGWRLTTTGDSLCAVSGAVNSRVPRALGQDSLLPRPGEESKTMTRH